MDPETTAVAATPTARLKLAIRGAVQGVGFRPFVFRCATAMGLAGWVRNSPQGVFVEAEGPVAVLRTFLLRLETEKPPRSFIQSLEASWLDPVGHAGFEIRPSETDGGKTALVLPDIATCPDCLREVFDPQNRRHCYPFTNCTHCGPRFSIIEALPYDRANTSMKQFPMCPQCQAEYDDPGDRRFHAQPNACPACGPHLELWNCAGKALALRHAALMAAAAAIRQGRIVAVKGLGGFHLIVAAQNEAAVCRLRERKHREEKPFALMFPSLEAVRAHCEVSALEERLLRSPEAPIILLCRCAGPEIGNRKSQIANSVAPGNPNLGVLLPYTPLHHLLLAKLGAPVVATSGNLSDEPICTDERDALQRLGAIADLFLVHNRPIVRHVDDSIVRIMAGRELVLRRARGYAPLPVQLGSGPQEATLVQEGAKDQRRPTSAATNVLAVGAHLKNTVALSVGPQVFLSQHIGDLETDEAFAAFQRVIGDFQRLYETRPDVVAADLHPDYLSTKFARALAARTPNLRHVGVQHHVAHVLSCMAENELAPPALGVSWDGTGYGEDGTVWGGEFFRVTANAVERVAHLRTFRLPGGDAAVKEPRRTALGLLQELFGAAAFDRQDLPTLRAFSVVELATLKTMLERGLNSPLTSSVGRLFDAVASLAGLRQQTRFEGQAAMELEFALEGVTTETAYEVRLAEAGARVSEGQISGARIFNPPGGEQVRSPGGLEIRAPSQMLILDWAPMIGAILDDRTRRVSVGEISVRFHNALVEGIVAVARRVGEERVVLSGGCFQNRYLTERTVQRLEAEGFRPCWHQRVPPNDGGIALGQVVAAARAIRSAPSGG